MQLPPVIHHTGLEMSGGATRVARLLIAGLKRQRIESSLSFELSERADGTAIAPEEFGRRLPEGALAHIHCTGDWPALLSSIPDGTRTFITLHDCELFTGGCPYPLDCPNLDRGCADPCPRNFPGSEALRKAKLAEVIRLNPVLTAPSRWLARLAKLHLLRSVRIIPNGIPWPPSVRSKNAARKQLGINPAARVILFAAHGGMNAAYKSGDAWQDIWQRLKAKLPDLLCFAVGGDREERKDDLVLWPYVDRNKLSQLMAAADVLLYPTKADNHSLVILEAMSLGLPVVAYSVGGVPEQIVDRATGLLVRPGDRNAFVQAALWLLSRRPVIRQMGQEAFQSGRKRFTMDRMVSGYMRLYRGQ
ncbi:glycosyltransferase [Pseudodesulfovibrio indicus]|uniref:Glycosyl transferase family 1 n=1 Tax=Pseudodesulfovibrio indicus TaxID=1716143 RepID=A0A126QKH4_9BACT|nr:glycosyltransferase [Pseudodesulfovibrio indicus]AMK10307.1 glycosyl transferase family 1 [Pseudodesulfovibrio indicus]TDT81987.1 glycosyltransferase involved in cell wall biosynthesis [Pseudodesulfovibrio indicus]